MYEPYQNSQNCQQGNGYGIKSVQEIMHLYIQTSLTTTDSHCSPQEYRWNIWRTVGAFETVNNDANRYSLLSTTDDLSKHSRNEKFTCS
jgi:hypothetical protein